MKKAQLVVFVEHQVHEHLTLADVVAKTERTIREALRGASQLRVHVTFAETEAPPSKRKGS